MKEPLLYFSPFLPQRSGIADYSEILVYGLRPYFDVTIVAEPSVLETRTLYEDFAVIRADKVRSLIDTFSLRLYNIGNNPYLHSFIYDIAVKHPGFVVLHDYMLYFLAVGHYRKQGSLYPKLYELGGPRGFSLLKPFIKARTDLLACKDLAAKIPLNSEIVGTATGIIVHSRYAYDRLRADFPGVNALAVPMVSMGEGAPCSGDLTHIKSLDIPSDAFIVASFGFIAPTKLNHEVCRAVMAYNEHAPKKIYYVMAGEGGSADDYLGPCILKTGFVEKNVYNAIMHRCDLVAGLRFPTMGETSISLIHAMSLGKPCMVTDDAWFAELPDSAVARVPVSDLHNGIRALLTGLVENPEALRRIGSTAREYVHREHRLGDIAKSMYDFLTGR